MTTSQPSQSPTQARGVLADALVTLAQTPDDKPDIDTRLARLAQLAADRVAGVDYASVTALRGEEYITVAASSDLAHAVDQAQYADQAGPCLQSLDTEAPVTVPEIASTMTWLGFHQAAAELGLHSSVTSYRRWMPGENFWPAAPRPSASAPPSSSPSASSWAAPTAPPRTPT